MWKMVTNKEKYNITGKGKAQVPAGILYMYMIKEHSDYLMMEFSTQPRKV